MENITGKGPSPHAFHKITHEHFSVRHCSNCRQQLSPRRVRVCVNVRFNMKVIKLYAHLKHTISISLSSETVQQQMAQRGKARFCQDLEWNDFTIMPSCREQTNQLDACKWCGPP